MKSRHYIIIFGIQGAGKGTQARLLSQKLNLLHISTGDLLRSKAQSPDNLGKSILKKLNQGELIDDDLLIEIIQQELQTQAAQKGIIFDGFPRTLPQVTALESLLQKYQPIRINVIDLQLKSQEIWERTMYRLSCPNCGSIYNEKTHPPLYKDICDSCHHQGLKARSDDMNRQAIERRVSSYQKQTQPLLQYYKDHTLANVSIIDASQGVIDVHQSICDNLDKQVS